MRLTETLMAPGAWQLKLRSPGGLVARNALNSAHSFYDFATDSVMPQLEGFIVLFDTAVTSPSLEASVYTGMLLDLAGPDLYAGESIVGLMNQTNGVGIVSAANVDYTARSLSSWFDTLFPANGLTKGVVDNTGLSPVAATWKTGQGLREFLTEICLKMGAEYRVNPDGTVDAAKAQSNVLFRDRQVQVKPGAQPEFGFPRGVAGNVVNWSMNGAHCAGRVLAAGLGDGPTMLVHVEPTGIVAGYGLDGVAAERTTVIDVATSDIAELEQIAVSQIGVRRTLRDTFRVRVDNPSVRRNVAPGDTILIVDEDNNVGGSVLNAGGYPQAKRVQSVSGPVAADYSVWLFMSNRLIWVNLTPYVEWDTGPVEFTVGSTIGPVGFNTQAWLGDG